MSIPVLPVPVSKPRAIKGVRVLANMLRMLAGLVLGMWFVRLLLSLGTDVAASVIFLGGGIGIGAVFQQLLQRGLTPVLSLAYHSEDQQQLRSAFSTCVAVSMGVAALAVTAFFILWVFLSSLQIPVELLGGVKWFVVSLALRACVTIICAPCITMLMAQGRMVVWNFYCLGERIADVLAVGVVLLLKCSRPSDSLIYYGVIAAALQVTLVLFFIVFCVNEASLKFSFRHISQKHVNQVLRSLGGNSLIVIATALYLRVDAFLINLSGGLFANLIFGVAIQLVGYVRLLTHVQALGIESIAARIISCKQSRFIALRGIVATSSRHQAIFIFPAMLLLAILAAPVTAVWLDLELSKDKQTIAAATLVIRIMLIGSIARALTEGWMRILNGVGCVGCYAYPIIIGGLLNAMSVGVLVWFFPSSQAIYIAATIFSALNVLIHLGWLPCVLAKLLEIRVRDVWTPILRPMIVALCCLPMLMFGVYVKQWNLFSLTAVTFLYLSVYGIVTFFVSLNPSEQRLIKRIFAGRNAISETQECSSSGKAVA